MTTPFCASTSTSISATQLLLESLTNYVLSNCIHLDSVIYLSQHIAFNGVIFTYQYHLRDIIIHRVTTKYQNKVDMKGLIVLKLMGCHNNSTIIICFTQRYKFLVHGLYVQEIRSHEVTMQCIRTKTTQPVQFHRLAVSNLLWISAYFNMPL